jgi:hypothetical protein
VIESAASAASPSTLDVEIFRWLVPSLVAFICYAFRVNVASGAARLLQSHPALAELAQRAGSHGMHNR